MRLVQLLLVSLSFIFQITVGNAASIEDSRFNTRAEATSFFRSIQKKIEKPNLETSKLIAQIEELMVLPYVEVIDFVMSKFLEELTMNKTPRKAVLEAYLKVLKEIANPIYLNHIVGPLQTLEDWQPSDELADTLTNIFKITNKTIESIAKKEAKTLLSFSAQPLVPAVVTESNTQGEESEAFLSDIIEYALRDEEVPKPIRSSMANITHFNTSFTTEQIKRRQITELDLIPRPELERQIITTLVRGKAAIPLLIGQSGAGRSHLVRKVAFDLAHARYPAHSLYQDSLRKLEVLELSAKWIVSATEHPGMAAQKAQAVGQVIFSFSNVARFTQKNLLLVIHDIDKLDSEYLSALSGTLLTQNVVKSGLKIMLTAEAPRINKLLEKLSDLHRQFEVISVPLYTKDQILKILENEQRKPTFRKYEIEFASPALEPFYQLGPKIYPNLNPVSAALRAMHDIAANLVHDSSIKPGSRIQARKVYSIFSERLGYPIDPRDAKGLMEYRNKVLTHLNTSVFNQEKMAEDIVSEWISLIRDPSKGVRTIMLMGPTGVGKSKIAQEFSRVVFNNVEAVLEVDGNDYKDKDKANNFFGPAVGYIGYDKTSGALFDFLDSDSRGKKGGVIIINEVEKADPAFIERLMELFDTGAARGANGEKRYLRNHLIVLTSNQGDRYLYPPTMEHWSQGERERHFAEFDQTKLKSAWKQGTTSGGPHDSVLARINRFSAAKPIFIDQVKVIAQRIAQKKAEQKAINYKVKITVDSQVGSKLSPLFFEVGQGVRPVESRVGYFINEAIEAYFVNHGSLRKDQLVVSVIEGEPTFIEVKNATNGKVFKYKIPTIKKPGAFEDQEIILKLEALTKNLKQDVIGQDMMIDRLVEAAYPHFLLKPQRPLSLFLVGTTGTGKTEVAKVFAKHLFGHESKLGVFDLGKVTSDGDYNDVFGSGTGFVGSEQVKPFEQFLINNPEGGVIVFDEISNMGGRDPGAREKYFKKLYSIFEEGTWVSPRNRSYNLSKYVIISTGNDLENLLNQTGSDELRMSVWKDNKSPEKVRQLLAKQSGIPEAFLGRQADIILMKPLLTAEMKFVAQKLLRQGLSELTQKGIEFEYSDEFLAKFAELFFLQSQGARSIRNLIQYRLVSAVTKVITDLGSLDKLPSKKMYISISDNKPNRIYREINDPARLVQITVTLDPTNPKSPHKTINVTDYIKKLHLLGKDQLRFTAYHEAGHAVTNKVESSGMKLSHITVIGQEGFLGFALYEPLDLISNHVSRKEVVDHLVKLYAGTLAEQKAGGTANQGGDDDLRKIRKTATEFILRSGKSSTTESILVDENNNFIMSQEKMRQVEFEVQKLMDEAKQQTLHDLNLKWPLVEAVAKQLIEKGSITGPEFYKLAREFPDAKIVDHGCEGALQ